MKKILFLMNDDLESLHARLGHLADCERRTVMAFNFLDIFMS